MEETSEEAGKTSWRGHVTHVLSGRRRYVQRMGDITDFIGGYLEALGVRLSLGQRLRRWRRNKKPAGRE